MFKILFFLSFLAVAFARPGYLHSHPVVSSYHAVPAVHVVRPIITSHSIATPVLHHHSGLVHGGGIHGGIHHGGFHHGGIHHGLF